MEKLSKKAFGKYIKKRREELEISREDLAKKLYVSYEAISNWEGGRRIPDFEMIGSLADELHVSVQDIYDNSREDKDKSIRKIINIMSIILLLGAVTTGILLGVINKDRRNNNTAGESSDDIEESETMSTENDYEIEKQKMRNKINNFLGKEMYPNEYTDVELVYNYFLYEGVIYEGIRYELVSKTLTYEKLSDNELFFTCLDEMGYSVSEFAGKKMENIVPLEENECTFGGIDLAYIYKRNNGDYADLEYRDLDGKIYLIHALRTPNDIDGLKHLVEYRQSELVFTGVGILNPNTDIYNGRSAKESFDELLKCHVIKIEEIPDHYEPFLVSKISEDKYIEISQLVDGGHEDIQFALIKLCDGDQIKYYKAIGTMM